MLSPLERKRLNRLSQQAQPSQSTALSGTVIGAGRSAGTIRVRLNTGAEADAFQLDNGGHALGTKLRITQQGGRYWAAGIVRI